MQKRAIGIVGGMGPMATLDLFGKLLTYTDAHSDAEHIRIYMDCHTGVPDRTKAILEGGESPVPYIVESAEKLASIGADFVLIPCNTSHYFYDEISSRSPVEVMNMIRVTAEALQRDGVCCVGLLATDGTVRAGVYQAELERCGIRTVCPNEAQQREVMRLIYEGVKAGASAFDTAVIEQTLRDLRADGAQRIVLGCTELPLGFETYGIDTAGTVDPATLLAKAAIRAAGYLVKE